MKINNNSINDKEINKNDTPNALISSDDLLKFFNLERDNVQKLSPIQIVGHYFYKKC